MFQVAGGEAPRSDEAFVDDVIAGAAAAGGGAAGETAAGEGAELHSGGGEDPTRCSEAEGLQLIVTHRCLFHSWAVDHCWRRSLAA